MANVEKLGVIGAGLMGNGIAHVAALAGIPVALVDVNPAALQKALGTITKNLERQDGRGNIPDGAKEAALARITTGTDYALFADCDLVIEAATENEEIKRRSSPALPEAEARGDDRLQHLVHPDHPAGRGDRPARPVHRHALLQPGADDEAGRGHPRPGDRRRRLRRGDRARRAMGKTVVAADDYPGFVVNRILCPMLNEAIFALMEGVGDGRSIDEGMKLGANHPMGPLELSDFVGLDTCFAC